MYGILSQLGDEWEDEFKGELVVAIGERENNGDALSGHFPARRNPLAPHG
jgi:hypothetical protein